MDCINVNFFFGPPKVAFPGAAPGSAAQLARLRPGPGPWLSLRPTAPTVPRPPPPLPPEDGEWEGPDSDRTLPTTLFVITYQPVPFDWEDAQHRLRGRTPPPPWYRQGRPCPGRGAPFRGHHQVVSRLSARPSVSSVCFIPQRVFFSLECFLPCLSPPCADIPLPQLCFWPYIRRFSQLFRGPQSRYQPLHSGRRTVPNTKPVGAYFPVCN